MPYNGCMKHFLFQIKAPYSVEDARLFLIEHGAESIYLIEDPNTIQIGGFTAQKLPENPELVSIPVDQEINWENQWELHSPFYVNGKLEIALSNSKGEQSTIYLDPGPGFGDLSHPTTQLMIEMLEKLPLENYTIIDIGCGSGVLSIAACSLGGKKILGIDIEEEAILHSRQNALLNDMKHIEFRKEIPSDNLDSSTNLFLINMTFEEQKNVFHAYPNLKGAFLISGLLKEQKEAYLEIFPYHPKTTITCIEKDGWIGYVIVN